MLVKGVGKEGKQIEVNNDFKITIPYGTFYVLYDKYENKNVVLISRPKDIPYNYKDGSFNVSDDIKTDGILTINPHTESATDEHGKLAGIYNIKEMLESMSKKSKNIGFNFNFNGNTTSIGNDTFRRTYKVCIDNEYVKAGYYTMGAMGMTVYMPVIFTTKFIYIGQFKFASENYSSNERYIDSLLKTIECIQVNKVSKPEEKLEVLSYKNSTKVKAGTIELDIPTELKYVTKENDKENILKDEFELLAVSKTFEHSPKGYADAKVGINIRKAVKESTFSTLWNQDESVIKEQITNILKNNIHDDNFKKTITFFKTEASLAIAYAKIGECIDSGPYWRSYTFFIAHNDLWYTGMIYFNCAKTLDNNYKKVIEDFLTNIHPSNKQTINKYSNNLIKDSLGDYLGKNNKIDAIKVSNLFLKDVVFNNDNEITYNGKNHVLSGLQFNLQVIDNYPTIKNNLNIFSKEIIDVMKYVENNDNLRIEPTKYHKNFNSITKNNPITGIIYFMFCAWHMITILEESKNNYKVILDENIIHGLPNGYAKITEYIKCLREYNEIYDDFKLQIIPVNNLDGPTGMISNKVKDADPLRETYEISVSKNNIVVKDKDEIKIDKDTLDYIKELSQTILKDLKVFAGSLNKSLDKINKQKEISEICSNMVNVENDNLSLFISYTAFNNSAVLRISYIIQELKEKTNSGYNPIEYNISFEFNGNNKDEKETDFPLIVIDKLNNLTEEEITDTLIEIIKAIKKNNGEIISTSSKEYVLEESGKTFELVGTEYEGRNERIEKVKVKDRVKLVREPFNEFDKNAIDVQNEEGSLGHLPAHISQKLAKLIDSKQLACTAVIESVTPLSKRDQRCKKALITITLTDEQDKQLQLFDTDVLETNKDKEIKLNVVREPKLSEEKIKEYELNKKIEEQKKEAEKAQKLRNTKIEEFTKKAKEKLENQISKLEKEKKALDKEYKKNTQELEEKIKEEETELLSLGIFSFKRKTELKENIEQHKLELNKIISLHSEKIKKINNDIESSNKKFERDLSDYIIRINKEEKIEELRKKTEKFSAHSSSSLLERERNELKCVIIDTLLEANKPVTITQLQKLNTKLAEYANQKISALLTELKNDDIVSSVIDKKLTYFYIEK